MHAPFCEMIWWVQQVSMQIPGPQPTEAVAGVQLLPRREEVQAQAPAQGLEQVQVPAQVRVQELVLVLVLA
jgi:hypothetical protein